MYSKKTACLRQRWLVLSLLLLLASPTLIPTQAATEKAEAAFTPPGHAPSAITLKSAVLAALEKHPLTTVGNAQKAVGEAYRYQADALFAGDPAYSVSYRSDQLNSRQGYREFEGSLDFPVWLSGQKQARRNLARRIIDKAEAEQWLLAWRISGEVMERAWKLRIAQMEVEQAHIRQQAANTLQADVKRKVQAGEIARADLLLAQQNTAQARLILQQAQAQVATARAAWQAYTGLTRLPVDLLQQSHSRHIPHEQHPHVIAAKARLAAARANRQDTRKQRRSNPTLSLYAKRDRGIDTDPFDDSLGISVSVPFGSRASSAPRLAEANAAVIRLQADEAERERIHQLEIEQARLTLHSSREAFSLAQTQHQLAQQRWKLSKRAFELGESDLFLLIQAREQADLQARAMKRSQFELKRSQARLNHLLGAMPL